MAMIVRLFSNHDFITQIRDLQLVDKIIFFTSNSILLTYYSIPKMSVLVPAWSLDIELQFYILFPLLYFITKRNSRILVILILVFFFLSIYLSNRIGSTWINNSLLIYLYLFLIGMAVFEYQISFDKKVEKYCLFLFLLLIVVQYLLPGGIYKNENTMYYVSLSILLVVLVLPTLCNSIRNPSDRRDKFLGEFSFLIYLSHWVWIKPYGIMTKNVSTLEHFFFLLLFILLSFGCALIVYWVIDRPMESLRHKWVNRQSQVKEVVIKKT